MAVIEGVTVAEGFRAVVGAGVLSWLSGTNVAPTTVGGVESDGAVPAVGNGVMFGEGVELSTSGPNVAVGGVGEGVMRGNIALGEGVTPGSSGAKVTATGVEMKLGVTVATGFGLVVGGIVMAVEGVVPGSSGANVALATTGGVVKGGETVVVGKRVGLGEGVAPNSSGVNVNQARVGGVEEDGTVRATGGNVTLWGRAVPEFNGEKVAKFGVAAGVDSIGAIVVVGRSVVLGEGVVRISSGDNVAPFKGGDVGEGVTVKAMGENVTLWGRVVPGSSGAEVAAIGGELETGVTVATGSRAGVGGRVMSCSSGAIVCPAKLAGDGEGGKVGPTGENIALGESVVPGTSVGTVAAIGVGVEKGVVVAKGSGAVVGGSVAPSPTGPMVATAGSTTGDRVTVAPGAWVMVGKPISFEGAMVSSATVGGLEVGCVVATSGDMGGSVVPGPGEAVAEGCEGVGGELPAGRSVSSEVMGEGVAEGAGCVVIVTAGVSVMEMGDGDTAGRVVSRGAVGGMVIPSAGVGTTVAAAGTSVGAESGVGVMSMPTGREVTTTGGINVESGETTA